MGRAHSQTPYQLVYVGCGLAEKSTSFAAIRPLSDGAELPFPVQCVETASYSRGNGDPPDSDHRRRR